jgi:hypothetical protein
MDREAGSMHESNNRFQNSIAKLGSTMERLPSCKGVDESVRAHSNGSRPARIYFLSFGQRLVAIALATE